MQNLCEALLSGYLSAVGPPLATAEQNHLHSAARLNQLRTRAALPHRSPAGEQRLNSAPTSRATTSAGRARSSSSQRASRPRKPTSVKGSDGWRSRTTF